MSNSSQYALRYGIDLHRLLLNEKVWFTEGGEKKNAPFKEFIQRFTEQPFRVQSVKICLVNGHYYEYSVSLLIRGSVSLVIKFSDKESDVRLLDTQGVYFDSFIFTGIGGSVLEFDAPIRFTKRLFDDLYFYIRNETIKANPSGNFQLVEAELTVNVRYKHLSGVDYTLNRITNNGLVTITNRK